MENLAELLVRDLRALLGVGIERVAEPSRVGLGSQPLDELAVNPLLNKQPAAGGAALAAVEIDGVERARDSRVEVGVGEDDVRAFAAEFEGRAFERLSGLALDDLGGVDVAGEGDLVDVRVPDECRAGGFTKAVEQVDHARRESRLDGQFADAERRQGRLLGGLHHDRVAAGERRAPLPSEHQKREIPRDDLTDDADRLSQGIREEAAAHRHGAAFHLVRPTGVIAERVDDALEVAGRVRDGLAAIVGFERGEFARVLLDQVGELRDEKAAIGGIHRCPRAGFQGAARGLDGAVDVDGGRFRDARDHLTGRRVDRFEFTPLGRINELVVDQQTSLADLGAIARGGRGASQR